LADAGGDILLHSGSVLKLMLNYAAQVQCFEASALWADADGDILLRRYSVLKFRPVWPMLVVMLMVMLTLMLVLMLMVTLMVMLMAMVLLMVMLMLLSGEASPERWLHYATGQFTAARRDSSRKK